MSGTRRRPKRIRVRDPLMVRVIQGATKAGVAVDRKKKLNKEACRKARGSDDER